MKDTSSQSLYIITGCSKGIGKAMVDHLLETEQAEVIGLSRTPMKNRHRFKHIQVDLADKQSLIEKLHMIFPEGAHYRKLVLINNAAWVGELKHIGNVNNEAIATAFAINSVAPAILMNAFVHTYEPLTAEKIVINISSSAGRDPRDGMSSYCSTKAALDMLTSVAAKEAAIKGSGIQYYSVSVGATDTPMQDDIREASEDNFSTIQRFINLKKTNKLLIPEKVAERILALTDKQAKPDSLFVDIR